MQHFVGNSRIYIVYELAKELNIEFEVPNNINIDLMEGQLVSLAIKELDDIEAEELLIKSLDSEYFARNRGFRSEFGIALFPFITSFTNATDALEIDARKLLNLDKRHIFSNIRRPKSNKIEELFNNFEAILISQFEGAQNGSSERFVWLYGSLMDNISKMPQNSCQTAGRIKLIKKLNEAVLPFFNYEEHNWDIEAINKMGHIFGRQVEDVVPKKYKLENAVKNFTYKQFNEDLVILLDSERETFQKLLSDRLRPIYNNVCSNIERVWNNYKDDLQSRRSHIIKYLDMLQ